MPSDDSAPHPLGYYRGVLRTPREPLGCRVRSLSTEILRYQGKASRIYLRADAEAERIKYAIRLPANQILQHRIGDLLKRPVGTIERGASVPCQFHLSGEKLDQAAPGDRQSRMASRRALSARRFHRHQPGAPSRAGRRLLQ